MASGGIRYDFTTEENFTQGEYRTVRIPIEDSNGDPVASFVGWTFAFYLYNQLKDTTDEALITKVSSNGGITNPAVAPNVDVNIEPTDTATLKAKTYWYELWRTDGTNDIRLAWGEYPIIN